jgi:D-alanyl-lipoteichoic acid acyltransferase DltB (MBOAT superfamily)
MILIGLWHGVTLNFVLWGFWHGLGLFIHNRWAELTKPYFVNLSSKLQKILNVGGVLFTFNYVALGWVFFALPEPSISLHYFKVLLGLA